MLFQLCLCISGLPGPYRGDLQQTGHHYGEYGRLTTLQGAYKLHVPYHVIGINDLFLCHAKSVDACLMLGHLSQ